MFETRFFEIIASIVTIVLVLGLRAFLREIIRKHTLTKGLEIGQRKYANKFFNFISVVILFVVLGIIWEVSFKGLSFYFASIFTIVGVALFANWSILSNITSGIIMFFSFPYKVGDKIQIHDKDFPIEAIIEDIRAFQLHLRLDNGNLVTYPNNLMLQKAVTLIGKDGIEDVFDSNINAT